MAVRNGHRGEGEDFAAQLENGREGEQEVVDFAGGNSTKRFGINGIGGMKFIFKTCDGSWRTKIVRHRRG